jgi:hypothetical protein
MSDDQKSVDSPKIGYGTPPKANQFKKGKSGNPKGRPKSPPKLADVFAREAARMVTVKDKGQTIKLTQLDLVVRRTFLDAMQGRHSAARLVLEGMQTIPERPEDEHQPSAHDLKLLLQILKDQLEDDV